MLTPPALRWRPLTEANVPAVAADDSWRWQKRRYAVMAAGFGLVVAVTFFGAYRLRATHKDHES